MLGPEYSSSKMSVHHSSVMPVNTGIQFLSGFRLSPIGVNLADIPPFSKGRSGGFDLTVENPPKSPFTKGDFSTPRSLKLTQIFGLDLKLTRMGFRRTDDKISGHFIVRSFTES